MGIVPFFYPQLCTLLRYIVLLQEYQEGKFHHFHQPSESLTSIGPSFSFGWGYRFFTWPNLSVLVLLGLHAGKWSPFSFSTPALNISLPRQNTHTVLTPCSPPRRRGPTASSCATSIQRVNNFSPTVSLRSKLQFLVSSPKASFLKADSATTDSMHPVANTQVTHVKSDEGLCFLRLSLTWSYFPSPSWICDYSVSVTVYYILPSVLFLGLFYWFFFHHYELYYSVSLHAWKNFIRCKHFEFVLFNTT